MTKDEALKLALEALELADGNLCEALHHPKKLQHGIGEPCPAVAKYDKAITAIREALAEQPAQQQEPVAFPRQVGDSTWTVDTGFIWRVKHTIDPDTPHDFTPSEEQIETVLLSLEKIPSSLYTTPPQRKPLLENEIKHLWYEACQTNLELTSQLIVHLARNIEAAHGIKGEA